jgi:hypothetical protein
MEASLVATRRETGTVGYRRRVSRMTALRRGRDSSAAARSKLGSEAAEMEGSLARISSRSCSWISGCVERRYAAQVNADEVVSCLGGLALESSLRIKGRARTPRLGR